MYQIENDGVQVEISGLFGVVFKKREVMMTIPADVKPLVPDIAPDHIFRPEDVKTMNAWREGVLTPKNLLLAGPTGPGKTSTVEQYCARMRMELYRVPCHGRMEFPELVGNYNIKGDFIDGPMTRAMRTGAVLLLDEINFINPDQVGGLNTVLDGAPLLIPETGEVIKPHVNFRIIATANDIAGESRDFKGTKKQNIALVDRFNTIHMDYLDKLTEATLINSRQPGVDANFLDKLLDFAADVRSAFVQGQIGVTLSTRKLIGIATLMKIHGDARMALQIATLNSASREDAQVITGLFNLKFGNN